MNFWKYKNLTTASLWAVVLFLTSVVLRSIAVARLPEGREFVGDYLHLVIAKNFGFVFSIPLPLWMILTLSLVVLGLVSWIYVWVIWRTDYPKLLSVGFGLITGGALSNFFERAQHGHVIDYLQISVFGLTGAWNIADVGIIVGIILWIVSSSSPYALKKRDD